MCQVHTGAYVSLLVPGETYYQVYRLPPKKDYHVYITRKTYHYAYARPTQVNWEKETNNKIEEKGKGRKEKTRKARKGKTTRGSKERKRENSHIPLVPIIIPVTTDLIMRVNVRTTTRTCLVINSKYSPFILG